MEVYIATQHTLARTQDKISVDDLVTKTWGVVKAAHARTIAWEHWVRFSSISVTKVAEVFSIALVLLTG